MVKGMESLYGFRPYLYLGDYMKKCLAVLLISTMAFATTPTYDKTASVVFEWGKVGGIGEVRPGETTYNVQDEYYNVDCAADEHHIRCGEEKPFTSMKLMLTDFHGQSGWFTFRPFLIGGGLLNRKDVSSKCPVIEDIENDLLNMQPQQEIKETPQNVRVNFSYRYGNYNDDIFVACAFDKVDASGHVTGKTTEAHYHVGLVERVEIRKDVR